MKKYDSFIVDDRPGEQWISLKRKYGDNEDITIEATMFDGVIPLPKADATDPGGDMQLHITVFVSISKGDKGDVLEFICSALPGSIEIRTLYTRKSQKMPLQACQGPEFKYDYLFCTYCLHLWITFFFFG